MLKQNAVRSKNAKLKCGEFSTLQKREIKMQRKISVLQLLHTRNSAKIIQISSDDIIKKQVLSLHSVPILF